MAYREPTREDDEALLDFIAYRVQGHQASDIAKANGVTSQLVRTNTNRVREADEKHVGRKLRGYWS